MLNIGTMEMVVLMLVAFIVVGPKDLPKVAKGIGRAIRYIRGLMEEVTATLNLEEEMEATKEIKSVLKDASGAVQEIKKTTQEAISPQKMLAPIEKEFDKVKKEVLEIKDEIKDNLQDD